MSISIKKNLFKSLLLGLTMILIPSCNPSENKTSNRSSNEISSGTNNSSSTSLPNVIDDPISTASFESLATADRNAYSLSDNSWKYYGASLDDGFKETTYNAFWLSVTIPHTWNTHDLYNGTSSFARKEGWYHRNLEITSEMMQNSEQYIEFLGVNMQAKVYINEQYIGFHKGGYTGFRFNISDYINEGDNLLAVWVSNVRDESIAPIGADFNFYGGIYRQVNLIVVDKVHVDLLDYGSSGLKLIPTNVSETKADLNVKVKITNESETSDNLKIRTTMKVPSTFEANPEITTPDFDVAALSTGEIIFTEESDFNINPSENKNYSLDKQINNPILWNGRENPFRYLVIVEVIRDGKIIDRVSSYVGFRYFSVTKEGGFFLNGKAHPLRGASRHQDWKDMGNAINQENHDIDFAYMYEMGMNSIRLAHYPHSNYFVDLCDKYGLITWAEIPFVNHIGTDPDFYAVTKNQLIELIRQQFNRPSICVWGLQNELESSYGSQAIDILTQLNNLAHEEDPTRLTAQATHHRNAKDWPSDLLAWNTYPGWYADSTMKGNLDDYYANYTQPVGISEYGYGANINQHTEYPVRSNTSGGVWAEGSFHPVEYQNKQHELAIYEVTNENRNPAWCAYIWNMFDFASAPRQEGSTRGMNDKGLITYDRKVVKDSFYLYKANWNKTDKFVHLTSKDFISRNMATTYVKAYSNCDSLSLYVNNQFVSSLSNNGYGIFQWENVFIPHGSLTNIKVVVNDDGLSHLEDSASWTRSGSSNNISITSSTLSINSTDKIIYYRGNINVTEFLSNIQSLYNAVIEILDNSSRVITNGLIDETMRLRVTAENGLNIGYYDLKKASISNGRPVTASSVEGTNLPTNVVDGNPATRWSASSSSYPQSLTIDLQSIYNLQKLKVLWYGSSRYYRYTVSISTDGSNYTQIVDFSQHTSTAMSFEHAMNNSKARFIRFDILSCSASTGYASIYLVDVIGWRLSSTAYQINDSTRTITINQSASTIEKEQFLELLNVDGDCTVSFQSATISNNDVVTITDTNGYSTNYTIKIVS